MYTEYISRFCRALTLTVSYFAMKRMAITTFRVRNYIVGAAYMPRFSLNDDAHNCRKFSKTSAVLVGFADITQYNELSNIFMLEASKSRIAF